MVGIKGRLFNTSSEVETASGEVLKSFPFVPAMAFANLKNQDMI